MPRPRSLTTAQIAAAALAVIDRAGLAGMTMRAVAAELGMSTMSLYRYVEDREQLEGLVVDLVFGAVRTDVPARASWSKRVMILGEQVRAAVSAHPSIVPLMLTHRHTSAETVRWAETMLTVLAEAGFTGRRRVVAFRTVLSYLVGALQVEHLGPLSGVATAGLAELPKETYPFLSETARYAQQVPSDEEFRRGLAVVLRGLRRVPATGEGRA